MQLETIEQKSRRHIERMTDDEKVEYIIFLQLQVMKYERATRQLIIHIPKANGHV